MRCARALPTLQLMPAASSRRSPVVTPLLGGLPGKIERPHLLWQPACRAPHPSSCRRTVVRGPRYVLWSPSGTPRMRENRVRSLAVVDPAWRSEPEDKFDPGNRWWGCALLPRARGSDSFPSLFGSCGRPRSCNPLCGKDIDGGRCRRCRAGGGADRGARSGQGRSGGMCASAEPPPARQADAGAARLRHHHGITVGDGGRPDQDLTGAVGTARRHRAAMMDALIAGQRDPRALAQLAKGRARKKTAQLEEALRGFFTDHHAAILRMMLDNTDRISAQIAALDARIEKEIGP